MTAVAGFSVFYHGKDQYQYCTNQGYGNCTPELEHFGFILFVSGLVILVLFVVLFFVVHAKVNRPEVS